MGHIFKRKSPRRWFQWCMEQWARRRGTLWRAAFILRAPQWGSPEENGRRDGGPAPRTPLASKHQNAQTKIWTQIHQIQCLVIVYLALFQPLRFSTQTARHVATFQNRNETLKEEKFGRKNLFSNVQKKQNRRLQSHPIMHCPQREVDNDSCQRQCRGKAGMLGDCVARGQHLAKAKLQQGDTSFCPACDENFWGNKRTSQSLFFFFSFLFLLPAFGPETHPIGPEHCSWAESGQDKQK